MTNDSQPGDAIRRRRILGLSAGAGLAIVIAVIVAMTGGNKGRGDFSETKPFPGLAEAAAEITEIRIESKDANVTVARGADGRFVVTNRAGFPADMARVRRLVSSLSELTFIERKTAKADRHEAVGLGLPADGGSGVVVTLMKGQETLAAIVVGKLDSPLSGLNPGTIYARLLGDDQTYIARGLPDVPPQPGEWLDKALAQLDPARLAAATLRPAGEGEYTLTRADPSVSDFTLENIPAGREPQSAYALNGPAFAVLGLTFEDVMPAEELDVSTVSRALYRTFDGLTIMLTIVAKDGRNWALIDAIGDPSLTPPAAPGPDGSVAPPPDVAAEAAAIRQRTAGYAFAIPSYVASQMLVSREMLLKPSETPAPAPEPEVTP